MEKSSKICKIYRKCEYQVKFWTKYVSNNVKIETVRHFNKLPFLFSFSIINISGKNLIWFLSYVILT